MGRGMIKSLQELVARLEGNPEVLGVARYGNRRLEDDEASGDFDLLVIVASACEVESLHFFVGDIPIFQAVARSSCLRGLPSLG